MAREELKERENAVVNSATKLLSDIEAYIILRKRGMILTVLMAAGKAVTHMLDRIKPGWEKE